MPNKLIRNCIVCGAESGAEIFSYTFDFMVNVRGTPPDRLRAKGFGDEETSTIVKCSKCGCNYIKDVLVDFQTASAREHGEDVSEKKSLEERTRATTQTFSSKQISDHLRMSKIYEKATRHVRAAGESRTKVLDFGAGSARFSNLAKVIGADLVVSYDLGYDDDVQDVFDAAYTNGIVATNKIEVVEEHGPYHVIFCQSMIEHVTDPQAILCHLQQNLHDAGIVYINNPIMNIDKEISELRAATSIVKKDQLSYYHPGHLNYMMPAHFTRLYKHCGLRTSRIYPEPFVQPKGAGAIERLARLGVHQFKNAVVFLRPDYPRSCFFLTK